MHALNVYIYMEQINIFVILLIFPSDGKNSYNPFI